MTRIVALQTVHDLRRRRTAPHRCRPFRDFLAPAPLRGAGRRAVTSRSPGPAASPWSPSAAASRCWSCPASPIPSPARAASRSSTRRWPLTLGVEGGGPIEAVDSFGNPRQVEVRDGGCTLDVAQMPVYLRLAKGRRIVPPQIDFGHNLAPQASFKFSAPPARDNAGDLSCLNNGIMETIHYYHPHGDPFRPPIFRGDMPTWPQTLEIAFPRPMTVDRMLVFGLHRQLVVGLAGLRHPIPRRQGLGDDPGGPQRRADLRRGR